MAPRLYGEDVSVAGIQRFADLLGVEPANEPPSAAASPDDVVMLWPRVRVVEGLQSLAALPYPVLLEHGRSWSDMADRTAEACREHGLYLSLSTATAYGNDAAGPFCDALVARGAFRPERRLEIELAISEAVANAVMHGNLELDGSLRSRASSAEDFMRVSLWLNDQISKPSYAERRLDLSARWQGEPGGADGRLLVSVADQGCGYDPRASTGTSPNTPAGRGLSIIRERTVETRVKADGTKIIMMFER